MKQRSDVFAYMYGGNIYMNLTNRCCNDCTFCLRNTGDGVGENVLWLRREPTADEAVGSAEKLFSPTVEEIVFCGYGEPTYRLDCIDAVADFAHGKGIKTRLNTNGLGSLINGFDIVPRLTGKIDTVSVSLNEANAAAYNTVCRSVYGEKAYEEIKNFTAKCVRAGIYTVMSVVDVIGEKAVERCREIAKKCGAVLRVRRYEKKW